MGQIETLIYKRITLLQCDRETFGSSCIHECTILGESGSPWSTTLRIGLAYKPHLRGRMRQEDCILHSRRNRFATV